MLSMRMVGHQRSHPLQTNGFKKDLPQLHLRKKKKKTFRNQCMKHLVDAYEKKAQSSKQSATHMSLIMLEMRLLK